MRLSTTPSKIELPRVAGRLANGATVLAAKQGRFHDQGVVLAVRTDHGDPPFVTWIVNEKGQTYWGHYHFSVEGAMQDYAERS